MRADLSFEPHAPGAKYFIRDDDVGELTSELTTMIDIFVARRLPVSYQVIPAKLTRECADYLLDVEKSHPDLIEFGQHGLTHHMQLNGRRLNREFGPERSYSDQVADIRQGLEMMYDLLGRSREIAVFTPPQHKYDQATVKAAAAVGHRTFSAACYPSPHHRAAYFIGRQLGLSSLRHHGISYHGGRRPEAPITEMSVAVAIDDGGDILQQANSLPTAMTQAAKYSPYVGLMLHHEVYAGGGGRAALESIADSLALGISVADFRRLGELAPQLQPGSG